MTASSQAKHRVWQDASDTFNSDCPVREVLDHITSRWAMLILTALTRGPLRFAELHRLIDGISEKMLSQTLRMLVRDGLVARTVEPTTPPRVSYDLTELGHGLTESLHPFLDWIYRHVPDVVQAQHRHDQDRE
ncbi:winged helix-turn-helix transcriptional regulator [Nocardia bovistercoris]|uniref:Helix-turn-helix transcriptional regulator n=1 Tax=Nocardia bovistercoris TaxID=2785916 RepID=A0A931MZY2_9NOCA|nr:helix-turn-helix domain-containing protein [Nocardia bovistercoris]MBH0776630.1 helix-turn-helix transcriptional regulator [Nocardia bovistercoris]